MLIIETIMTDKAEFYETFSLDINSKDFISYPDIGRYLKLSSGLILEDIMISQWQVKLYMGSLFWVVTQGKQLV